MEFKNTLTKRIVKLIFVFNLLFQTVLGNTLSLADSLENVLKQTPADTAKVMVYNRFARSLLVLNMQNQDYQQALQFAQQGLELAQQIRYTKGESELLRTVGSAYYFLNENEKAVRQYELALEICEKLQDLDCAALNYYNLAILYQRISRFYFALDNFKKALAIWSQAGNLDRMVLLYRNIVQLYLQVEELQLAENWAIEALEMAIKNQNREEEASIYTQLARINVRTDDEDGGKEYFQKALHVYEELGDNLRIAITLNNMAQNVYRDDTVKKLSLFRQAAAIIEKTNPAHPLLYGVYNNIANILQSNNQADSALYYYEKSLNTATLSGNLQSTAQAYSLTGMFFMNIGDLNRAERDFQRSYEISARIGATQIRSNALSGLSAINHRKGNYEKAFDYLKRYQAINDSLIREDSRRNVRQLTIQHEFEKDQIEMRETARLQLEHKQQELRHQKILSAIILIALVLTAILMVVNIRTNRELNRYKNNLEGMVETKTSELTIAKEKAEEANRFKTAFLANMSHEIRTPLNAIVGFLNFIGDVKISATQREEYIGIVNNCSKQLVYIIDEIIDISKIEANQMNILPVKMQLNSMMTEMLTQYEVYIHTNSKKQIELILDDSCFLENDNIFVDSQRLKQIISNLLNNAVKFTEKGYVRFGYSLTDNNLLEFFVEDTGIGIAETQIEHVFEQFRQADLGNNRHYGGIGLGLSISQSLVRLMGGEITVKSSEGTGSTFSFTITCLRTIQLE